MRCEYYEKKACCEATATQTVWLRGERIGRVCDKHADSLTSHHPRTIKAKPLRETRAEAGSRV